MVVVISIVLFCFVFEFLISLIAWMPVKPHLHLVWVLVGMLWVIYALLTELEVW
jgi:hypothetical protein